MTNAFFLGGHIMVSDESNTGIPTFLRAVTIVECLVVFAAGFLLFFQPGPAKDVWAWTIAPFNSRYMGAVYFAAFLPLLVFAWTARWCPGRVILWMIFVFTTAVGVVMVVYAKMFEWARRATWVFWPLYLFLPFNAAYFLYRLRGVPVTGSESARPLWRAALLVLALN